MSGDEWRAEAACLGMDAETFYPYPTESPMPAKRVCRTCPVRRDCLIDALGDPISQDFGVRGGLTEAERLKLRRQRERARLRQDQQTHYGRTA